MAIPLGISLKQIAGEAVTLNQTRSFLSERFGADARVAQLDMDFDADPVVVRAVVITPRDRMQRTAALQSDLTAKLGRPLRLRLDQVLLEAAPARSKHSAKRCARQATPPRSRPSGSPDYPRCWPSPQASHLTA